MAEQLVGYRDLPDEIMAHLTALEEFIGDVDGLLCIDEGTIDADDAVKAFNGIVAYLRKITVTKG